MQTVNSNAMFEKMPDISTIVSTASATLSGVVLAWFAAKRQNNKDKVETADSKGRVEAIGEWKAIAESKDKQIDALTIQNKLLMDRNQELYESNQTLSYNIGDLKNQISALQRQVDDLSKQIGTK